MGNNPDVIHNGAIPATKALTPSLRRLPSPEIGRGVGAEGYF